MAKKSKTQDFVPIKEIRDGIITLKNGGMRAVLLTTSVNVALKSEDEFTALLIQFQNFLNSLDFQVQIVIQSRRLNIKPYLNTLNERLKAINIDLLRLQTQEYIGFIKKFTDDNDIMTKQFYVVISYDGGATQSSGGFSVFKKDDSQKKEARFEEKRSQIEQRVAVVEQGLSRVGLKTAQLDTEQIIELYYKTFNPGEITSPIKLEE